MIDRTSGRVEVQPKLILTPETKPHDIKKMGIKIKSIDDMHTGWIWYRLKPIEIKNLDWNFHLGFFKDELKIINFVFKELSERTNSWENWSEETEKIYAEKYHNWLEHEIGSERKFSWGKAHSGYDARSGASSISIIYDVSPSY